MTEEPIAHGHHLRKPCFTTVTAVCANARALLVHKGGMPPEERTYGNAPLHIWYDTHTTLQCVDSHASSKGAARGQQGGSKGGSKGAARGQQWDSKGASNYRQNLLHEVLHVLLTVTYQCGVLPAICPSMALKHVELFLGEVTEVWHNILPYWVRGGVLQRGACDIRKNSFCEWGV